MLTLLLAGLLAPVAYSFGPDTRLNYDVTVGFDGFLPLMGGNEGKVDIKMGVGVVGQAAEGEVLKAASEITEFEVSFNGAKLPLGTSNVVEYFPKTTITIAANGKILTNDAPDKKLPIRLPGLDVKHFPDVTYVPIELSTDDMVAGLEWKFSRDFGGSPVEYTCVADSLKGDVWKIKVNLKQTYKVLESPTYEVVAKPEDAVSEVETTMTGEGFVEFDLKAGRVVAAEMSNMAVSDVKDIKTGETKQRKLGTKYVIKLRNGSSSSRPVVAKSTDWWAETMAWGQKAVRVGQSGLAWLQTAALFGLQVLPKELEQFRPLIRRWAPWLGA